MRGLEIFLAVWFLPAPVVIYGVTRWTKLGRFYGTALGAAWPVFVALAAMVAPILLLWKVADLAWQHAGQYEEPIVDDDGGW